MYAANGGEAHYFAEALKKQTKKTYRHRFYAGIFMEEIKLRIDNIKWDIKKELEVKNIRMMISGLKKIYAECFKDNKDKETMGARNMLRFMMIELRKMMNNETTRLPNGLKKPVRIIRQKDQEFRVGLLRA